MILPSISTWAAIPGHRCQPMTCRERIEAMFWEYFVGALVLGNRLQ